MPGLSPALRARMRRLFRVLGALSPALAARLAFHLLLTPLSRRIGRQEARFLAGARSSELSTGGGRVHAYEWPAADPAAPTVLIVHGWISHTARMAIVIQALRERGLRVVAFDAPAHGRSSGWQADLQAFRSALSAVIGHFGPVQGVLAHSFGALTTATWLAEDQPPQVRAAVLVGLMDSVGYVFESFTLAMALDERVLGRLRELFRARYGGYPEEFSTAALLQQLRLPVLMVHGGADELVPAAHARQIAGQLCHGELLIAAGQGHSAPLRDAGTVARIADYLAARLAA